MVKIFKAFEQNERFYVVFNFSTNSINMVTKEELESKLPNYKVDGVLIGQEVQKAWNKDNFYVEDDGSLAYFIFVMDLKGSLHRLKFNVYANGKVDRSSVILGSNQALINKEFGVSLI